MPDETVDIARTAINAAFLADENSIIAELVAGLGT